MTPTKEGQTVLFRAYRLREFPAITGQFKGVMTVTSVQKSLKGYMTMIQIVDEAGKMYHFQDYWLKTTRTKPTT